MKLVDEDEYGAYRGVNAEFLKSSFLRKATLTSKYMTHGIITGDSLP
jgi:hypothetical protein